MIKTGKAPISVMTYIAIMSINLIVNLPGLAVAPMEGRLKEILQAPELEVQLLTILPNFLIFPFVLLSGKLSLAKHKIPIIVTGLIIYSACAIAYMFANSMLMLIIISCVLGCGAGLLIPFAAGLIADTFTGKFRMKQMGWKSGISNSSVVIATFAVGWLIESSNWHLPFIVYLLAIIPLVFSFWLKNVPDMGSAASKAAPAPQPSTSSSSPAAKPHSSSPAAQPSSAPLTTDNDGAISTPFTEEIVSEDVKLNERDHGKELEIKVSEDVRLEKEPSSLKDLAEEIAEEASELSLDALKLARGENITTADIENLTQRAQQIAAEEETKIQQKKAVVQSKTNPVANNQPNPNPVPSGEEMNKEFYVGKIWGLIGVYFFVTFTAIAITNYCSQLVASYNWSSTIAGDVTAIFFLFVLLPGYCLPFFVKILRGSTFFWTAIMLLVGLGLFVFIPEKWAMFVGSALTGLGYGICQPVLYDKASYTVTNPAKVTLALSFVLTANYLAIAVEPFVISGVGNLLHVTNENMFAFKLSLGLVIAYTIISLFLRKKFAFSVDKSYYS